MGTETEIGSTPAKPDTVSPPAPWAKRFGHLASRIRWPAILGSGVAVVFILMPIAAWLYKSGRVSFGHTFTTGTILVDGPQIYTRERLVNDRYQEDSWLRSKLAKSDTITFKPVGSLNRNGVTDSRLSLRATAERDLPAVSPNMSPAPGANDRPIEPVDISPMDALQNMLVYREQLRDLIIENQLDDRHDLRGNSLYRLKFNASIMPGYKTEAFAKVEVTLQGPQNLSSKPVNE